MSQKSNNSYLGNDRVKRDGVVHNYTAHEIEEYQKCMEDPCYFAKNYAKIISLDEGLVNFKLYDYQERYMNHLKDNRFSITLACRQSGKSITSVIFILWYATFHPEKTIAILANKGATAREMLSRIALALENLPFFLQAGCKELNKGSITFSNNSKIVAAATSASSIRGMSISCVVSDTMVCIENHGSIYYTTLKKADCINKSKFINVKEDTFMNLKNNKKYYTVYKITNTINNKEYIGFHSTDDLEDGYLGSGKIIKKAIEKYGPDKFEKEYIEIFDNKEDAELLEQKLVDLAYVEREDTYNQSLGGNVCILYGENNGFYGKSHTDDTKKKISEKNAGKKHTKENIEKISMSSKLMWLNNEELKQALSKRMKERIVSEETRKKISESHKGKKLSEESKKKISNSALERFNKYTDEEYNRWYKKTWTKDHKEKISKSLKGKFHHWQDKINKNPEKIRKTAEKHRGMKRSEESKKKMSESAKRRGTHNKNKVYCYDPKTLNKKLCFVEEVPQGWIRGFVPKELKCKS